MSVQTSASGAHTQVDEILRVRIKFSKQGGERFLSHLDLLTCVERAIRRSGVPVAFTEGFHARIRIGFGPALALGHASTCEWMDLDLAAPVASTEIQERLNRALPGGLRVSSVRFIPSSLPSLQAEIRRATYRVTVCSRDPEGGTSGEGTSADTTTEARPSWIEGLASRIEAFLRQQEIPLLKKNRTVNLRAYVDDVRITGAPERNQGNGCATLELVLRTGPDGSVRPEEVLGALGPGDEVRVASVERTGLLAWRNGEWEEP